MCSRVVSVQETKIKFGKVHAVAVCVVPDEE
jgi:hypothetical protein